jgi:DNA-binding MarR family transcriptional regulator
MKRPPDPGDVLHDLFREVFVLRDALAARMDEVHARAGLHTPQVTIMEALRRFKKATVPELAAELRQSRQSVQTVCNTLLARGLIAFAANPRHKRSKLAALTVEGRRALACHRKAEAALIGARLPEFDINIVCAAHDLLADIRRTIQGGSIRPQNRLPKHHA